MSALKDAGFYSAPAAPPPVLEGPPPPAAESEPPLPRFIAGGEDGAPERIGSLTAPGRVPPWVKASRRRVPWRAFLRDGLAWIATIVVVGAIIWGTSVVLMDGSFIAKAPPAPDATLVP